MNYFFRDRYEIDAAANVKKLADGRIVARPRVARTGIQLYRGSEVGRPDMDVVRVYRSPAAVFDDEAVRSFLHVAVTNDHPPEMVTPRNYVKYSKGWTGDEAEKEDNRFLRVPMMLADHGIVEDYESGKRQLSNGYTCDLDWTPGTDPDSGEQFDASQINIRGNHVALVKLARGGQDLHIGDAMPLEKLLTEQTPRDADDADLRDRVGYNGEGTMAVRNITVDEVSLEVSDVAASVITAYLNRVDKAQSTLKAKVDEYEKEKKEKKDAFDAAIAKHTTDVATHVALVATKDAEIATLKSQLADAVSPAKMDAHVLARATIIGKAKAMLGDALVVDGKSNGEVMRQVVDARLKENAKGWTDEQVKISFDTLAASVQATDGTTEVTDTTGTRPGSYTVADVARSFRGGGPAGKLDAVDTAYAEHDTYLENAWKTPQPAARQ